MWKGSNVLVNQEDITSLLSEHCSALLPGMVILPGLGTVIPARLARLMGDLLVLDLLGDTKGQPRFLTSCVVSYYVGSCSTVFITRVESFILGVDEQPSKLTVKMPGAITLAETRQSVRVPVVEGVDLDVVARQQDKTWRPRPLDISLSGIRLEFADDPGLAIGARLLVELALEEQRASLQAEVRRRVGTTILGLFFPGVWEGDELNPPQRYANIVTRIERHWIKKGGM